MARYIDADRMANGLERAIERMNVDKSTKATVRVFIEGLQKYPTADVVEVKHGEWIEDGEYQICSVCGEEHHWDEYRATYCEDCGAKMDGGEKHDG